MTKRATNATHSARGRRRNWAPGFLEALGREGTVTAACHAVGIQRSTAYRYRDDDETFAQAWDDIDATVVDRLEREGVRRAMEGSDKLLEFFLKAKRPTVYRENVKVEHTGADGGPIELATPTDSVDRSTRAAELLARAGQITVPATVNGSNGHSVN